MKNRKILTIITIAIIVLSAIASGSGLYTGSKQSLDPIISVWGESIILDGQGIYARDSASFASQGRAQDIVTLFFGIPLLIRSFVMYFRGNLKGFILYPGT